MAGTGAELSKLLRPAVEALGYELLGVELHRGKRTGLVRLYIDSEGGITVEDCERVSRQVSAVLDLEDPVAGEYNLEVSSPGADRPLFEFEHFVRFAGEDARIRLRTPIDGQRNYIGTIGQCEDGVVRLVADGESVELPFEEIGSARLIPSF